MRKCGKGMIETDKRINKLYAMFKRDKRRSKVREFKAFVKDIALKYL